MSRNYVEHLKEELALAEKSATPVIVEVTERSHERVVFEDRTHGTTRIDWLGGTAPQYIERPVIKEAVTLEQEASVFATHVPSEVGKVVSQDETKRTIELVSGTVRTDHR